MVSRCPASTGARSFEALFIQMKRAIQFTFSTVAAISLLIAVSLSAIAITSHPSQGFTYRRVLGHAYFWVNIEDSVCRFAVDGTIGRRTLPFADWGRRLDFMGMHFNYELELPIHADDRRLLNRRISGEFPLWRGAFLFGLLPCLYAFVVLSSRHFRGSKIEGHCPICGYDLRATPDRCPECGTSVHIAPLDAPRKRGG